MEFFNETICVLLVVAITIIFIKTIYSHKKIENFQDDAQTPIYFGLSSNQNISERLLRDADFMNEIRKMYLNEYNEKIVPAHNQSKEALELAEAVKNKIDSVPEKYSKLLEKYNELNNNYKLKKKEIEGIVIKELEKSTDLDNFNKKNLLLQHKLRDFTNTLKDVEEQSNTYKDGLILRCRATNNELSLVKNQNSGSFDKYKLFTDINRQQGLHDIYYLSINGKCLESQSRGNFTLEECIPKTMEQFFMVFEIKNNEMYNKYIKASGNFGPEHLVDILDTSIDYPFFVISPFNIPGYAVTELNKKIYIHPVRNDPFQQFKRVNVSSFCEIIDNE